MAVTPVDDLQRLLGDSRIGKICVARVLRGARVIYLHIVPQESASTG